MNYNLVIPACYSNACISNMAMINNVFVSRGGGGWRTLQSWFYLVWGSFLEWHDCDYEHNEYTGGYWRGHCHTPSGLHWNAAWFEWMTKNIRYVMMKRGFYTNRVTVGEILQKPFNVFVKNNNPRSISSRYERVTEILTKRPFSEDTCRNVLEKLTPFGQC